jgi:hypothetical protein
MPKIVNDMNEEDAMEPDSTIGKEATFESILMVFHFFMGIMLATTYFLFTMISLGLDHWIYLLVYVGEIGFFFNLLSDLEEPEYYIKPLMGIGFALGISFGSWNAGYAPFTLFLYKGALLLPLLGYLLAGLGLSFWTERIAK